MPSRKETNRASLVRPDFSPSLSFAAPDYDRRFRPLENKVDEVLLLFRSGLIF